MPVRVVGLVLVPVAPAQLAGGGVEGLDDAGGTGDVEHAVVDQRVRLGPPLGRQGPRPREPEPLRVAGVDLVQRAVAPPVEGAPPVDPVGGVRVEEHRLGDRRERRLLRVSRWPVDRDGCGQHQRLRCDSHTFSRSARIPRRLDPSEPAASGLAEGSQNSPAARRAPASSRSKTQPARNRSPRARMRAIAFSRRVSFTTGMRVDVAAATWRSSPAFRLMSPNSAPRRRPRPSCSVTGTYRSQPALGHPGRLSWVGHAHRTGPATCHPGRRSRPIVRTAGGRGPYRTGLGGTEPAESEGR